MFFLFSLTPPRLCRHKFVVDETRPPQRSLAFDEKSKAFVSVGRPVFVCEKCSRTVVGTRSWFGGGWRPPLFVSPSPFGPRPRAD